jgi:hypothetical protein
MNKITVVFYLFYFVDVFVLFVHILFVMKNRNSKSTTTAVARAKADKPAATIIVQSDCPPPEAFLEEAKKEPKRILLTDFTSTIRTLRIEKKFTFRAIAEWLAKRGIETDHSAVYRVFLASIPEGDRNPFESWSEVDEPGFADQNVELKKP